ncbi:hypothetical protein AVEN_66345-1 [Araneus ventricosus]|uniref:Uncharacterized protein n=1 Tax=Araneus ventricosus TaxID=182803 RepID=A0A4Y2QRR7_ARAVE|nr:hypothetical protein AVEN_66345-1 [Araneus ventricosus]
MKLTFSNTSDFLSCNQISGVNRDTFEDPNNSPDVSVKFGSVVTLGIVYIPFLVYLKDYLEKNNTNQNFDATMKLSMEEKWLQIQSILIQRSRLVKLHERAFAVQTHNANVERIFPLVSTQCSDERSNSSVNEAVLICHYRFKMNRGQFYNYVKEENDIIKKVESALEYDWDKK